MGSCLKAKVYGLSHFFVDGDSLLELEGPET